jgi:tetratricopeptide (TPR) repeat protein
MQQLNGRQLSQPAGSAVKTAALVALVGLAGSAGAAAPSSHIPPINEDAAEQAKYTCPAAPTLVDKQAIAARLEPHTYSKNDLACAAEYRFAVAQAAPADREAQVAALAALERYMDHVATLRAFDLLTIDTAEFDARADQANQMARVLIPRAQAAWPDDAAVLALTAVSAISSAGDGMRIAATRKAIDSLERSIALDPKALNGFALAAVGRIYAELSPLYGGDTRKAIERLQAARAIDPGNPLVLRLLASSYLESGDRAAAMTALQSLLEVSTSDAAQRQYVSDELRQGEGIASRLGDAALSRQFADRRTQLLKANPNLLVRNSITGIGHGGDNPVTGERQYSSEHGTLPGKAPGSKPR